MKQKSKGRIGTPTHVEYLKKHHDDPRRDKRRCLYYRKPDGICASLNSPNYKERCPSSSKCQWYKEKIANTNKKKTTTNLPKAGPCIVHRIPVFDFKERIQFFDFIEHAKNNDPRAMYETARCYEHGKGISQSYEQALNWYHKALDNGYNDALLQIGLMYENGFGVTLDLKKALSFYEKAAIENVKNGMERATALRKRLGISNKSPWELGIEAWEKEDWKNALLYYSKSLKEYRNKQALCKIGDIYYQGLGVNINYRKAHRCYIEAAVENKDSHAMHLLGIMYLKGEFVNANLDMAYKWLTKAVSAGCQSAQYDLKMVQPKVKDAEIVPINLQLENPVLPKEEHKECPSIETSSPSNDTTGINDWFILIALSIMCFVAVVFLIKTYFK